MEEKKYSLKMRDTIIATIVMVLVFVGFTTIDYKLYSSYNETNELVYYFISVLFEDPAVIIIFFLFLLLAYLLYEFRKEGYIIKWRKVFGIALAISAVIVLLIDLSEVSNKLEGILIDNKRPSKLEYKYNIFLDVLENETVTENIPTTKIRTYTERYTYRKSTTTHYSYYVSYWTADNRRMSVVEEYNLVQCIEGLKEIDDNIQIEYYPHSGIIKSINGVVKHECNKLDAYISDKVEEIELKKRLEEEEILRQEEEANKIARRKNTILNESIGRNIDEVMLQFEEEKLSFESEIIYISSQMYDIGTIVFRNNEAVYVVKDNLGEDMVPIPNMELGMTKEQIISLLTEAEFDYHCSEYSCDTHGKNKLHTYQFSPGTLVPRGYDVGFSVDK